MMHSSLLAVPVEQSADARSPEQRKCYAVWAPELTGSGNDRSGRKETSARWMGFSVPLESAVLAEWELNPRLKLPKPAPTIRTVVATTAFDTVESAYHAGVVQW